MSIADKIARAKEDYNDVYGHGWSKGNMAGISEGFENGRNLGHQEGYDEGYAAGVAAGGGGGADYDQGVEDGKQAAYDAFWDNLQCNGNRTQYAFAFSADFWTPENFKPKYPIAPITAQNCFAYWGNLNNSPFYSERIDFRQACELDTSNCTNISSAFTSNRVVSAVGTIDARKASNLSGMFNTASNLETIEKFILKDDGSQTFQNAFRDCSSLKEIRIDGVIGQDIDFSWSKKLSAGSIFSIIGALSTEAENKAITLSKDAVSSAFETAEGLKDGENSEAWNNLVGSRYMWSILLV